MRLADQLRTVRHTFDSPRTGGYAGSAQACRMLLLFAFVLGSSCATNLLPTDTAIGDGALVHDSSITLDEARPSDLWTNCDGTDGSWVIACNGACVDLRHDAKNCGACGNACDEHPCGFCAGGGCAWLTCFHCACVCTDPKTADDNCGACGNICPLGFRCLNSVCVRRPDAGG